MNRVAFFEAIGNLRHNVWCEKTYEANQNIDTLIQITERDKTMTIEQDVANIIKRIKSIKEDEKLETQAEKLIAQIKESLE